MGEKRLIDTAEKLLKAGKNFESYNILKNGNVEEQDSLRMRQLYGLSLARLGATLRAQAFVGALYDKGHRDGETSGLLGRIYKDMWKKTDDVSCAVRSRDIYYDSFKRDNESYTGINAATMSLVVGQNDLALRIAREIVDREKGEDDYWSLATRAEGYLLLDDFDNAFRHYQEALRFAGGDFGSVSSTYRQLCLINKYREVPQRILDLFKPPAIVIFSGHMLDRPDRPFPRFTENIAQRIQEEIGKELEAIDGKIGYSSAACGTDIQFIEVMKRRGGETNIILPFGVKDFIETSVGYAGERWVKRFNAAMRSSYLTLITEENYLGCDELFSFANNIIVGMASLRSYSLDTKPILLAVIDSGEKDVKDGGTISLTRSWDDSQRLRIIDIAGFKDARRSVRRDAVSAPEPEKAEIPYGIVRSIKCIMFADIAGFSKIPEEYTPYFMHDLLDTIGKRYKDLTVKPEIANTWGDAIFIVYNDAKDMIEFALLLRDTVTKIDWTEKKLPKDLSIRISLHAGPIFLAVDSITNKMNAYGAHINRTARIEPITVPGCIYASMQFAAKLIYETGHSYQYEYVGILELPKNFGKQEIFRISKKKEL
jgi:class 3 adenylate cyclase/tetratricopeptide (TPR) repeat protein